MGNSFKCCCRKKTAPFFDDEKAACITPTTSSTAAGDEDDAPSQERRMSRMSEFRDTRSIGAMGKPFPKRPIGCKLSQEAWQKLENVFRKMDPDGSNAVTRDEARLFFKGAFGKLSADAMFNEVDVDGSGAIDADEFVSFWVHVRKNGYKEQEILDELDELLDGGAWVDWKDGRDTASSHFHNFPKRPILCRLNQATWDKCRDLFMKMDTDHTYIITHEKASKHFQGAFSKVSMEAMFNEIDQKHHGQISAKEWMKFWVQVKSSGYKHSDILDELENLMQGSAWVDWKDGRSTT